MNTENLRNNTYPGRGIVLGASPNGAFAVQVYWTMGRSENSKKRVIAIEDGVVKTIPTTNDELVKPDLVIYPLAVEAAGLYVVSNGAQTAGICEDMANGLSHEAALAKWKFEHDEPIYTPRITGVSVVQDSGYSYQLSIVKPYENNPETCMRQVFSYETAMPGLGHCIHTYAENGTPCPAFGGEPFVMPLFDDMETTMSFYWDLLPTDYMVGMIVKFINIQTGEAQIIIRNAIQK